jgi:hypothetical protein
MTGETGQSAQSHVMADRRRDREESLSTQAMVENLAMMSSSRQVVVTKSRALNRASPWIASGVIGKTGENVTNAVVRNDASAT